jgi:hypothetical protein
VAIELPLPNLPFLQHLKELKNAGLIKGNLKDLLLPE